jgi:uncharacterized transporter YbjL
MASGGWSHGVLFLALAIGTILADWVATAAQQAIIDLGLDGFVAAIGLANGPAALARSRTRATSP